MQTSHKINWKDVSKNVCGDIEGRIGEIECINVDTVTGSIQVPGFSHRAALEYAGQYIR